MSKLFSALLLMVASFNSVASPDIDQLITEGRLGNAYAAYSVARAYDTGNGVTQDKSEAVEWYKNAARLNESSAQIALGLKYVIGKDIPQNKEMAYVWFRAAEENGHKMGSAYRLKIEKELSKQQIESAEKQYLSLEKDLHNK